MGNEHCDNPESCHTTIEREKEMEQLKRDYKRTHEAIEESTRQIAGVNLTMAENAGEMKAFVSGVKESADRNDRAHEKLEAEQKNIHSRINTFKEQIAKEVAGLKVADEANRGKTNKKLDLAEIGKLALLMGTILGIFKYLLPAM